MSSYLELNLPVGWWRMPGTIGGEKHIPGPKIDRTWDATGDVRVNKKG